MTHQIFFKAKFIYFKTATCTLFFLFFSAKALNRFFFIHLFSSRAFTLIFFVLFLSHGVTSKPIGSQIKPKPIWSLAQNKMQ